MVTVVDRTAAAAAPPAATQGACSSKPRNLPHGEKITVNGVPIDRAAIARETQNHPADKPIDAWLAAARALVVRELLLQEARARGLGHAPLSDAEGRRETDEEALIRTLVETDVVTPKATPAECQRYYEHNRFRFRTPDLFEARHILCAADPKDPAARNAARARAEAAIAVLAGAPERFAALAEELSTCPSAQTGGSLGQISRGQTVPEFEAELARLPVGRVGDHPVETRYGFHVVLVERRIAGAELPFEMVRERIAEWLGERVRRTALSQYIAGLAERAEITGLSLDAQGQAAGTDR